MCVCVCLQFRVIGFDWHCLLVLAPPVLPIHKPQLGWRHHDHVTNTTATQVGHNTHAKTCPHYPHTHTRVRMSANINKPSNNTKCPPCVCVCVCLCVCVCVLQGTYLLPYTHAMDSRHFSHVLWHHMAWHEPLGIRTYVVYATGRVGRLMAEPLVRALVAAGRLFVVALKDLPAYESTRYKPALRDLSGPQVCVSTHSHALRAPSLCV